MVVRTKSNIGIIIALIIAALIIASVIGYIVYQNLHKGGYKCTERGCIFMKDGTQTKQECLKEPTCIPKENPPVKEEEEEEEEEIHQPEPRFVCSRRESKRVWVQVDPQSVDYSHAWTVGQITSHANMGYCHYDNQNEHGICPDLDCNTDYVYVLPVGYDRPLLWSNWIVNRPWWLRRYHPRRHGGRGRGRGGRGRGGRGRGRGGRGRGGREVEEVEEEEEERKRRKRERKRRREVEEEEGEEEEGEDMVEVSGRGRSSVPTPQPLVKPSGRGSIGSSPTPTPSPSPGHQHLSH